MTTLSAFSDQIADVVAAAQNSVVGIHNYQMVTINNNNSYGGWPFYYYYYGGGQNGQNGQNDQQPEQVEQLALSQGIRMDPDNSGELMELWKQAKEQERDKALKRYADEYVQMGDDCQKHDMVEAAMRNYDKAVTLCPAHKQAWIRIRKLDSSLKKGRKK